MDVFVYGTLTAPDRVAELLDDWSFGPEAVLRGAHRVDGRYPTLAPGGETTGRILRTPEVDTLDRYEGVEQGLYRRVAVSRDGDGPPVQVYVGDPLELGLGDDTDDWPEGAPGLDELVAMIGPHCTVVPTPE